MSGPATSWTSPAGHATTGIVGTVDSAYKAERAVIAEVDGLALAVAAQIALESAAVVMFGTLGPSAGVRGPAPGQRAAGNASMQRGWWRCGTMGDEGSEAQQSAAARAARLRGGLPKAGEEVLDA